MQFEYYYVYNLILYVNEQQLVHNYYLLHLIHLLFSYSLFRVFLVNFPKMFCISVHVLVEVKRFP